MKSVFFTICFLILSLISTGKTWAEEIIIDDFTGPQLSSGWQKKYFVGETKYFLTREDGNPCLKAISDSSASGMFYKKRFNPAKTPFISWSWKIDSIIRSGNALHKKGDDYAARVYVVFPSIFFWNTKAINYIWANRLPKGSLVLNPFTKNAAMFAVQSGPEHTGTWMTETRNIYEDYKKAFQSEPPFAGAVAIMTDTDNTGEVASACFGPIRIHSSPTP